jgi:hypothetical protein
MRRLVLSALLLAGFGCSDSSGPEDDRFVFRDPLTHEVVRLEITNSEGRAQAEDLLASGEARWALGTLKRGDGGFNGPWTWHIDPATVTFAEVTIEACQTAMSAIDDDLDYWIDFGQVCIWGVVESRAN